MVKLRMRGRELLIKNIFLLLFYRKMKSLDEKESGDIVRRKWERLAYVSIH